MSYFPSARYTALQKTLSSEYFPCMACNRVICFVMDTNYERAERATSDVWAVSDYLGSSSNEPLIENWSGSSWHEILLDRWLHPQRSEQSDADGLLLLIQTIDTQWFASADNGVATHSLLSGGASHWVFTCSDTVNQLRLYVY